MIGTCPLLAAWPFADLVIAAPDTGHGMAGGDGPGMRRGGQGGGISVCAWQQCRLADTCPMLRKGGVLWCRDLERLKRDGAAMANLRQIVAQTEDGFQPFRMDDDLVISQFVRLVAGHRFALCAQFDRVQQVAGALETPAPAPPAPAPPPPRKSPAPSPVMAPTAEVSSFPPTHDAAAQAAALVEAALTGEPFCEECEKARKEQAAAPGPGD